ncbi:MAG TPA: cyclic nucleotide-binding domain-containing protein [Candidatus Acidoferrum sp.]|nr:cyclic nucleotide-binding domain-containing protein [Candidatus Acidoferrum sp.]
MLMIIERVVILKSVDIFATIAEDHLVELARMAKELEFRAGDPIMRRGESGTSMYIIISGRVRIHAGDRAIAELGGREVIGELAALDPEVRSADVTALEDTRAFCIESGSLYELMGEHVDVNREIIRVLCRRLRRHTAASFNANQPV